MNGLISDIPAVFNKNPRRSKAAERAERASLPVLAGFLGDMIEHPPQAVPARILSVWCPFCRQLHKHSWATRDRRAQPRKSHCDFFQGEYLIRPFTKQERVAMGALPNTFTIEAAGE
jgi:hypothetical protein